MHHLLRRQHLDAGNVRAPCGSWYLVKKRLRLVVVREEIESTLVDLYEIGLFLRAAGP